MQQDEPLSKGYRLEILGNPTSQKNNKQIIFFGRGKCPACKRPNGRPSLTTNKQSKKWRKEAVKQLALQWMGRDTISSECAVIVTGHMKTRRRFDADNLLAGPLDALKEAGVISDDFIFTKVLGIREYDKENPRVEIRIMPADWLDVS